MLSKHTLSNSQGHTTPADDFCLGGVLRNARTHRGLTQTRLAELCGLSAKTVSLYERGLRRPSWTALQSMLENLGFRLLFQPVEETLPMSQELVATLRRLSPDLKKLLALLAAEDESSHGAGPSSGRQV
jgi:transcriptional regulator with XRE-family HTH domain